MIAATLADGRTVMFEKGKFEISSGSLPDALGRPQTAVRGEEVREGREIRNERVTAIVEPGTGEHARAALLAIDATILIDDGDA